MRRVSPFAALLGHLVTTTVIVGLLYGTLQLGEKRR